MSTFEVICPAGHTYETTTAAIRGGTWRQCPACAATDDASVDDTHTSSAWARACGLGTSPSGSGASRKGAGRATGFASLPACGDTGLAGCAPPSDDESGGVLR